MREIKFRVWDEDSLEMVEGGVGIDINGIAYVANPLNEDFTYYPDCPIMQATGLKDKNGTDIYEGDILKSLEGNYIVRWFEYDEQAFANNGTSTSYPFMAPAIGFGFEAIMDKQWYGFDHKDFKLCYFQTRNEVIGNIYENPELLK